MSRRKDRERIEAFQRLDPDYRGFRGRGREPQRLAKSLLEPIVCAVCGRKRNVLREIALERRDTYVCMSCTEEGGGEDPMAASEA